MGRQGASQWTGANRDGAADTVRSLGSWKSSCIPVAWTAVPRRKARGEEGTCESDYERMGGGRKRRPPTLLCASLLSPPQSMRMHSSTTTL
jgi:hypothetical protein